MARWLAAKAVCARYGNISDRTIDRWVDAGVLSEPTYICGRRYWSEERLDQDDVARAARPRPSRKSIPRGKGTEHTTNTTAK
jgi:hypothetical protein